MRLSFSGEERRGNELVNAWIGHSLSARVWTKVGLRRLDRSLKLVTCGLDLLKQPVCARSAFDMPAEELAEVGDVVEHLRESVGRGWLWELGEPLVRRPKQFLQLFLYVREPNRILATL